MTALGLAIVVAGVILIAVEAHLSTAGVVGVAGVAALVGGAALTLSGAGAGLVATLVVVATLAAVAGGLLLLATRRLAPVRRVLPRGGRSGLVGRTGVVRSWGEGHGKVLVDGALWRAQDGIAGELEPIGEGDPIVVDHVQGLTLRVRKAEDWEVA